MDHFPHERETRLVSNPFYILRFHSKGSDGFHAKCVKANFWWLDRSFFLSATAQFIFRQRQRELIMCDTESVMWVRDQNRGGEKKEKKDPFSV